MCLQFVKLTISINSNKESLKIMHSTNIINIRRWICLKNKLVKGISFGLRMRRKRILRECCVNGGSMWRKWGMSMLRKYFHMKSWVCWQKLKSIRSCKSQRYVQTHIRKMIFTRYLWINFNKSSNCSNSTNKKSKKNHMNFLSQREFLLIDQIKKDL